MISNGTKEAVVSIDGILKRTSDDQIFLSLTLKNQPYSLQFYLVSMVGLILGVDIGTGNWEFQLWAGSDVTVFVDSISEITPKQLDPNRSTNLHISQPKGTTAEVADDAIHLTANILEGNQVTHKGTAEAYVASLENIRVIEDCTFALDGNMNLQGSVSWKIPRQK